ncbi:hypothetical protein OH76DRAFT_1485590 [Lentinus brumalis]|uniref:Uncharacterized protein n=1 Tax=Lentinus brumalis TaxID=2498619 RepID=A0A371D1C6_9APHY|nr:hypothetical protein OH76DRAFT_1485590 [Polyporus brumalis]
MPADPLSGSTGPSTPANARSFSALLNGPYIPGDSTPRDTGPEIHLSCIVQADHDQLTRSRNVAYALARQQIEGLACDLARVQGEAEAYRRAFDELISKVPQLLGMPQTPAAQASFEPPSPSCTCVRQVVLGFNWDYPQAPAHPPTGILLKFWAKEKYDERPIKESRGGQHGRKNNVGQDWIEDEAGKMISGIVAKNLRDMLSALLHSIVWSGQAGEKSAKLPHEARVYIHVILARQFPFLLLCDDGKWKINELIVQMYSTFASTHIKPAKPKTAGSASTGTSRKRARDQDGSDDTRYVLAAQPAKSAQRATTCSTPGDTSDDLSSLNLFTMDDLAPESVPAMPNPNPMVSSTLGISCAVPMGRAADRADASAGITSANTPIAAPAPVPIAGCEPEHGVVPHPVDLPMQVAGHEGAASPPGLRSDTDPNCRTGVQENLLRDSQPSAQHARAAVPRPTPLPITRRVSTRQQTTSAAPSSGGDSHVSAPADGPGMDDATSATTALNPHSGSSSNNAARSDITHASTALSPGDVLQSQPEAGVTHNPESSAAPGPTGPRKKSASAGLKAISRHNAKTISPQSFYIAQRIREDANVLYADCVAAYKALPGDAVEALREQCRMARQNKSKAS